MNFKNSHARLLEAFLLTLPLLFFPVVTGCVAGDAAVADTSAASLTTGIVEESSMSRVLAESAPGTVVVFDIDNTLLTPVGHLGSDEWYDYLRERGVARGETVEAASRRADDAFNRWQPRIKVRSVDPATPAVIAELRRPGITLFALTARSAGAREVTLRQLDSLRLVMDTEPFAGRVSELTAKLGVGTGYENGVFFIGEGGLSKGEALVRILDVAGLKPTRIVFVDDKPQHTVSVDAALSARHIPHLCLRFSRKDAEVAAFRQDMAHFAELASGVAD